MPKPISERFCVRFHGELFNFTFLILFSLIVSAITAKAARAGGYHGVNSEDVHAPGAVIQFEKNTFAVRDRIKGIKALRKSEIRTDGKKTDSRGEARKFLKDESFDLKKNTIPKVKTILVRMNPILDFGMHKADAAFRRKILEIKRMEYGLDSLNRIFSEKSADEFFRKNSGTDVYLISFNADQGVAKLRVITSGGKSSDLAELESLLESAPEVKRVYPDMKVRMR